MATIEKERLIAAAKDINNRIELDPKIPTSGDPDEIEEAITQEGRNGEGFFEGDGLSKGTIKVLGELDIEINEGSADGEEPTPPKTEEENDDDKKKEKTVKKNAAKPAAKAKGKKTTAAPKKGTSKPATGTGKKVAKDNETKRDFFGFGLTSKDHAFVQLLVKKPKTCTMSAVKEELGSTHYSAFKKICAAGFGARKDKVLVFDKKKYQAACSK